MTVFVYRIPASRIIPQLRNWGRSARPSVLAVYGLASGTLVLSPPHLFSYPSKELMEETKINCPLHCYHEPLHQQVEEMKKEAVPKSLMQCILLAVRKVGSCFHLVFRAIYIMVVFSPTVLMSWFLFFPSLRKYWNKILVASLQVAGSSFMKLGQWAATRPDILPIELCKELSTLHSTTKCLDFDVMLSVIEKELGKPADLIFDVIEETPVGSGCIAQVYKARLRGSDDWVAVKVKRPHVDEIFKRDLQLVNFFAHVIALLPMTQYMAPVMTAELFTKAMQQQLDFRLEAINLIHFNDNFRAGVALRCDS